MGFMRRSAPRSSLSSIPSMPSNAPWLLYSSIPSSKPNIVFGFCPQFPEGELLEVVNDYCFVFVFKISDLPYLHHPFQSLAFLLEIVMHYQRSGIQWHQVQPGHYLDKKNIEGLRTRLSLKISF